MSRTLSVEGLTLAAGDYRFELRLADADGVFAHVRDAAHLAVGHSAAGAAPYENFSPMEEGLLLRVRCD